MQSHLSAASPVVRHNLFFAAKPSVDVTKRIAAAVEGYDLGRTRLALERLHVTLLMVIQHDELSKGLAEEAAEVAASVHGWPFPISMGRLVAGAHSTLLLPDDPLEALRMFRERLGFALLRAGLPVHLKDRFSPHMTLGYGGGQRFDVQLPEPIVWMVEDFTLIDSFVGLTQHVECGRWPLRG